MKLVLVAVGALLVGGCKKEAQPQPVPVTPSAVVADKGSAEAKAPEAKVPEAKPPAQEFPPGEEGDRKAVAALPIIDVIGYLSGNYGTSHNHPALYADPAKKQFVMMGRKGVVEVPFEKLDDALAAYEQFVRQHGYEANGKAAPDDHQKIMVDGKEMVVMSMSELMPEMPSDTRLRFSDRQYGVLRNTASGKGFKQVSGFVAEFAPHPLMFAGAKALFVLGPDTDKQFPIEKADDAFAEYRAMLARTKIVSAATGK